MHKRTTKNIAMAHGGLLNTLQYGAVIHAKTLQNKALSEPRSEKFYFRQRSSLGQNPSIYHSSWKSHKNCRLQAIDRKSGLIRTIFNSIRLWDVTYRWIKLHQNVAQIASCSLIIKNMKGTQTEKLISIQKTILHRSV